MKRLLVIGDGQLGLMLAEAASRIGLILDRVSPEQSLLFHGTGRHGIALPHDWSAADYEIVTAEPGVSLPVRDAAMFVSLTSSPSIARIMSPFRSTREAGTPGTNESTMQPCSTIPTPERRGDTTRETFSTVLL